MLPGPKVLIIGPPGTGKTYALRTIVKAGYVPFIIFTEQSQHLLNDLPPASCHWHYIRPSNPSWAAMSEYATFLNSVSPETIVSRRDPNMRQYTQFLELLSTLSNFKCDRTGEEFGPVDHFDNSRVLVIDHLTGINTMVMRLITGGRYARSIPEWNIMQGEEEKLIDALVSLTCGVIVLAHAERERNEITGSVKIYASAIGSKLAPKLGGKFDEVIYSKRLADKFIWDNIGEDVDTKFRLLPPRQNLPQDYGPLFAEWKARGGQTQTEEPTK